MILPITESWDVPLGVLRGYVSYKTAFNLGKEMVDRKRVDGKAPGTYFMDHSAASYVYDTQGKLRLYTRYGSGAQALADDIRLLLQG